MTLKEFEKIKKAMQRINELDLEIVEIEKFAEKINQEGAKMQFDLSVNLPVKKEEADECQIEESITERIHRLYFNPTPSFDCGGINKKTIKKPDTISSRELSDVACYQILSVLLSERKRIRESYINQIESLGVKF